ncbi:nicotinate-nucleotide adenylyltransferase [Evansella sp. AB-rgal1]|uniref:nicotinate-nucleotide adenylyltransferase n=1 Tax=Evansella sp. AB-rgal1 TaxID=3242696 RepID=UPI00359D66DE
MKRIGILGGTFDPPHIGHLFMAEEARLKVKLDEVWWMPNRIPPHKEIVNNTSQEDRLEMVKKMVALHESYSLCEIELQREGFSYSTDTMELLTKEFPDIQFFFILGEDSLLTLNSWYKSERLQQLVTFIVIRRPGFESEKESFSENILMVEGSTVDVSSSSIRDSVQRGLLNRFLLTKDVYEFIKERQLYG